MWRKKNRRRSPKAGDLTAFIDEGSEVEGKCTFAGTVMLNGTIRGEITSADTVIVGEKAAVHANVHADTIFISGQVVGNLVAAQRLEMHGAARVSGNIEAPVVVMEEGVFFQGHCHMSPKTAAGAPAAAPSPRDLSVVR
jgi:cytoskeletal protein CcmA (bactofilin family)